MKYLILAYMVFMLASCFQGEEVTKYPYRVWMKNGKGLDSVETSMLCDSVKMKGLNHAKVYRDGSIIEIFANSILVSQNEYWKKNN